MQITKRRAVSILLAVVMVVGMLFAIPMTANAATGMATIDISTLAGSNADNTGTPSESQWAYNSSQKTLYLKDSGGNYTLSGTNASLEVVVDSNATNANIKLNNVSIAATAGYPTFAVDTNCILTLMGNNSVTASNFYAFFVGVNRTCTINGSGSLTANGSQQGIFVGNASSVLNLTGSATVTAKGGAGYGAIHTSGVVKIDDSATLTIDNSSGAAVTRDFTKYNTASTHQWKLTGAATGTVTAEPITVTVAAGATGTIQRESAAIKTVSVGAQNGALTTGTAGSATFSVTTANITNGTYPVMLNGAPTDVTAGSVTITSNSGTLTLNTTEAVAAGTYPLTISIDGTASGSFNLVVSPVAASVCSIGGTGYPSFKAAVDSVANGGTATIVMTANSNEITPVVVDGKTINLQMGNYTLNLDTSGTAGVDALTAQNGGKLLQSAGGTGKFNIMGAANGAFATGTGSQIIITGSVTGGNRGVNAVGGAKITVTGDVEGTTTGARAADAGSEVTVTGHVTGGNYGVSAGGGAKVTVEGDVTSNGTYGVYAGGGAKVTVEGDVISNGDYGVYGDGGAEVIIEGDVTSNVFGVYTSDTGTDIKIVGDVLGEVYGAYVLNGAQLMVEGNVTGTYLFGALADGAGAAIDITGDVSGDYYGMYVLNGAEIVLNGNVTNTGGVGACAKGAGTVIDITGDITAGSHGVYAIDGAEIKVEGDIAGHNDVVFAESGGKITVVGDIDATGALDNGARADGANTEVSIIGDITTTNCGVIAKYGAELTLTGNIVASTVGAFATENSEITINGSITASLFYVNVCGGSKGAADVTTPTTKTGYLTYKLPILSDTSTVWVRALIAPTITTSSLPGGKVGTAYNQTLTATGDPTITWALDTGTLPGGLSLSTAGVISGTPTASGTFNFTVKAENGGGNATKSLTIVIAPLTPPVLSNITTSDITKTSATVSVNYDIDSAGTIYRAWYAGNPGVKTAAQIKDGVANGALSGGSSAITASSRTYPSSRPDLAPNTQYTVYFVATDDDGDSNVISITFTTLDVTLPVLSNIATSDITESSATVSVNYDIDSTGTIYRAWYAGNPGVKTAAQIKDGVADGALNGGSSAITAGSRTYPVSRSDLTPNTQYTVYFVATDDEGDSNVISITFTTLNVTTYAITVTSGTSDKTTAASGETVTITAGTAPAGQTFDKWTTLDGVTFANDNAASTTFVMPAKAVTVTATYKALPPTTYAVTVTGGTSDKVTAASGETVTITAGTAPAGQTFDKWTTSDGLTFANDNAASTTFVMPAKAVTVTATYKALPPDSYTINVQSDGNGTANANVNSATAGTEITLTATPNSGYRFKEWQVVSGGVTITANKFTMPTNTVTVKAIFEAIPGAPDYKITSGANSSWKKGNADGLTITCDGDFAKFTGIKIDGTLIDVANYTKVAGSTVITLNATYLDTLSVGAHTVEFIYADGSVQTGLTIFAKDNGGTDKNIPPVPSVPGNTVKPDGGKYIEYRDDGYAIGEWKWDDTEKLWIFDEYPVPLAPPDESKPTIPETGDNSNMMLWILLGGASLTVLGGMTGIKKRKRLIRIINKQYRRI